MLRRLLALALLATVALAQQHATEEQVKAAYLYNFGKFATWQSAPSAGDFQICVIGQDPFGEELDKTIAGGTINGAPVRILRLSASQDTSPCRIAYIGPSEHGRLKELLPRLTKQHVLAVSDMPDFLSRGGVIALVRDGNRVRFDVNLPAANAAGVSLSSELLRVAKQVITQ